MESASLPPTSGDAMRSQEFDGVLCRARSGDREAVGTLLQWYANYLMVLATTQLDRRLRRRLNPSDIVQEAMMAAHRDFDNFRGESQGELLCWLRTILINTLRRSFATHVKVEKRDVRREISIEQITSSVEESAANLVANLPARHDSPSAPMRQRESAVELADRLSVLKPEYREVIVLRVLNGFAFDQIAEKMGRSSGAVRMLWLRALEAYKNRQLEAGPGMTANGRLEQN